MKLLAKEVISSRKTTGRLYQNKAQMNSVSMMLSEQLATIKAVGHLTKSTEARGGGSFFRLLVYSLFVYSFIRSTKGLTERYHCTRGIYGDGERWKHKRVTLEMWREWTPPLHRGAQMHERIGEEQTDLRDDAGDE